MMYVLRQLTCIYSSIMAAVWYRMQVFTSVTTVDEVEVFSFYDSSIHFIYSQKRSPVIWTHQTWNTTGWRTHCCRRLKVSRISTCREVELAEEMQSWLFALIKYILEKGSNFKDGSHQLFIVSFNSVPWNIYIVHSWLIQRITGCWLITSGLKWKTDPISESTNVKFIGWGTIKHGMESRSTYLSKHVVVTFGWSSFALHCNWSWLWALNPLSHWWASAEIYVKSTL